jgi:siroheme synthase
MARAVDTLVLYMGVGHLAEIAAALIDAGRPADEPAAIVQAATLPDQRIHHFTLDLLRAGAAETGIAPPAIVVIGPVVRVHHQLLALAEEALAAAR